MFFLFDKYFDLIFFLLACFFFNFLILLSGRGGERYFIFLHFLILGIFSVSCYFILFWVLGEGEMVFLFFHVFLVFLNTFGTDSFCPRRLFLIKILDPKKNIGQYVLFFWAWTSLRGTHRCVVWCVVVVALRCVAVGAVCVQDFHGCVQDLGAPPESPSAGPPRPTAPQLDLPPPDRPKFRFFQSLLRHNFLSFYLGVSSWNFGGVLEAPGHSNVHVWALRLSCETPATFAKCQEQFHIFCPQTSEKVNNQLLQILLVSRKKASNTTEIPWEDAFPPHLLALTFSGLLFVLFVLL